MKPITTYELVVRSGIIRSDKPSKGLDATAAPNQQQMNRITGFLADGTPAVVAQRPGKGGMDFTKLLGGKVFAVAADGLSPVFEKEGGKPTKNQKVEDGKKLFSSSGFYLLSSKDYPALDLIEAYTHLLDRGTLLLTVSDEQLADKQSQSLSCELDMDLFEMTLESMLDDGHNLVAKHDEAINKKRERGVRRGQEEAEDAGERFSGPAFKEVAASKKDGNPFVAYSYECEGVVASGIILRQVDRVDDERDSSVPITFYLSPEESVAQFKQTPEGAQLCKLVDAGKTVNIGFCQGHVLRTSVSFRKKAENVLTGTASQTYGDGVYVMGASSGWTRGLVATLHSMHPAFPTADYEAHHYVAMPRQAEVGMSKKPDGNGWTPPVALQYDLNTQLRA